MLRLLVRRGTAMSKPVVFDASALLAVIFDEPGAEGVVDLLPNALVSTVSLSEVHERLVLRSVFAEGAWTALSIMGFTVSKFDSAQAKVAAEMILKTREFGLSMGDRACLALASVRKARVYTTDRVWAGLDVGVEVVLIR